MKYKTQTAKELILRFGNRTFPFHLEISRSESFQRIHEFGEFAQQFALHLRYPQFISE